METHAITLPASHYRKLEKIVTALIEKWDTHYIMCFGCVEKYKATTSYFPDNCRILHFHSIPLHQRGLFIKVNGVGKYTITFQQVIYRIFRTHPKAFYTLYRMLRHVCNHR